MRMKDLPTDEELRAKGGWAYQFDTVVRLAKNHGRTDKEIVEALAGVRIGDYKALEEASVPLMKRRRKKGAADCINYSLD